MNHAIYAILHNIRSLHNIGSLFRTADAAGVTKIYLTGYTASPIDRFGKVCKEIAKTALGAERTVPWEAKKRVGSLLISLRKNGVYCIGLEQDARAVDYRRVKVKCPFALVVGNEVSGLSKSVLEKCDTIAEIPMRGTKESLNVSVAFGVALFQFIK
ncbi:MAG: tRNA/rRNA methyltransferase SpoU [Parcubacteria group bacterium Gr01-1014_29]|nr:MAG: tRNA/rRNA methyltransferase SpoU [Parcubacteria group bacterium Gr01-1014_29]